MRLLFLADDPPAFQKPTVKPKAKRLSDYARRNFLFQKRLARAFAKRGSEVLFVTAEPSGKPGPVRFSVDTEGDLLCLTLFLTEKTPFSAAVKASSVISENAAAIAGFFEPDAVISAGFYPVSIFAAEKIARFSGAVLVSFVAAAPKKIGALLSEKAATFAAFRHIKTKSAAVFGSYPRFSADFSGRKAHPFLMPPQKPASKPSEKAKELRERIETLREGGTFVLTAAGPFGKGFSVKALLRAAGNFDKKTAILLSGTGSEKPAFERFIRENGLTNVTFGGEILPEDLSFVLGASDAVFLSENADFGGSLTESDRFLAAFGSQRPILATVSAHAGLFRESKNAIFTAPDDAGGLLKGLETLRGFSDEHRTRLGEQGRIFADRHDFFPFFEEFSSFLLQLVTHQKENVDL